MVQSGSVKPVVTVTDSKTISGPAMPVYGFTAATLNRSIQCGAALKVVVVSGGYVATHGLIAGEPMPIYEVANRGVGSGTAVPVYLVGGNL